MQSISIVIPVYNEAESLSALLARLKPVLEEVGLAWEILFVNDGSRDATLEGLRAAHAADERVTYISLSRNFGKEAALTAGLHHARGDAVVPMDADLQDPPELLPEMVRLWQGGYKVVLATRRSREGEGAFKRFTAYEFYRLMSRVSTIHIPENTGDFRLMDRQVVEAIRHLPERTRFMKGLFAWVGFTTAQIYYDRPPRAHGAPKQSLRRLWQLAKDGIFSFTTLPLRITTYLGAMISLLAVVYALFLVARTLVHGVDVPGYASLMTAVLLLGGLQLLSLGILGEYIGRIYREAKQRPVFVVEEVGQ